MQVSHHVSQYIILHMDALPQLPIDVPDHAVKHENTTLSTVAQTDQSVDSEHVCN
jgi:hypothetical protein